MADKLFCFAFEYHLQYELPKPPPFCNISKFAKIDYVLMAISTKVTL
jgi:hypothetical protein